MRDLTLLTERFPDHPGLDTGISHAIVRAVGAGSMGETLRLFIPDRIVAFGRQDRHAPGYPAAVAAAKSHGFLPIERLAGGRAAVFHESTLAFAWAIPTPEPRAGIAERFAMLAEMMAEAFVSLGLDARVGEIPGEYCPGRYSVNLGGTVKVMGVGQRLVSGAAHVGGVVVVDRAAEVRDVLIPVYEALGLPWDPATVGALSTPGNEVSPATAAAAIVDAFARRHRLHEGTVPGDIIFDGHRHLASHLPVP